jgi:hypothetical protein
MAYTKGSKKGSKVDRAKIQRIFTTILEDILIVLTEGPRTADALTAVISRVHGVADSDVYRGLLSLQMCCYVMRAPCQTWDYKTVEKGLLAKCSSLAKGKPCKRTSSKSPPPAKFQLTPLGQKAACIIMQARETKEPVKARKRKSASKRGCVR